MKRKTLLSVLLIIIFISCHKIDNAPDPQFIRVENGEFMIGDSVYRYIGTNFWYGAILGSTGQGGNRQRLIEELDLMQKIGISNLRVLVGADGEENIPSHVMPVLQTSPGVYNDTILDGLDYLMSELEKRDMKAVLYLNNAWEWSGGYGTYLDWVGDGVTPNPAIDGYDAYVNHVARFVKNDSAKLLAENHTRNIVTRTNRYTGQPYSISPALMSWQIANEPRAFAADSLTKTEFAKWIASQAALIKSLDNNHMVSTGSEGKNGCEQDIDLWYQIHSDPNIDYGIIHVWPYNWNWINEQTLIDSVNVAKTKTLEYIKPHSDLMKAIGKPLVLEEFGYPRDGFSFQPGSSTNGRDEFYKYILTIMTSSDMLAGCNFWGWGGYAAPQHVSWQKWDDYTVDPAHEQQGLNSVFAKDKSTLDIISQAAEKIKRDN